MQNVSDCTFFGLRALYFEQFPSLSIWCCHKIFLEVLAMIFLLHPFIALISTWNSLHCSLHIFWIWYSCTNHTFLSKIKNPFILLTIIFNEAMMLSVLSSLHIPIFLSKIVQFKTLLFFLLLTLTDVSTTCAIVIFRVKENDCDSEDWPPHGLSKCPTLSTTVLFRTTFYTQMIMLNLLKKIMNPRLKPFTEIGTDNC